MHFNRVNFRHLKDVNEWRTQNSIDWLVIKRIYHLPTFERLTGLGLFLQRKNGIKQMEYFQISS